MPIDKPLLLSRNTLIHIIGICGLGMSAIAKLLLYQGYRVQGSDQLPSDNIDHQKFKIFTVHSPNNIRNADLIIKSTAILDNNVELLAAKDSNIPIFTRKEILAELVKHKQTIAISGTHGKTTTTSMLGTILDSADYDPTIISGGIMNLYNDNIRVGKGNWNIVEADESDGTFLALQKSIAIVTNTDIDHLDYYKSYYNLINHFQEFISEVPFNGCSIVCQDQADKRLLENKRVITYGINNKKVDLQLSNIRQKGMQVMFDVTTSTKLESRDISNVIINSPGIHNIYNAGAAICAAIKLGITTPQIIEGLRKFQGVQKRFSFVGKFKKMADVILDYAHHPTAIIAAINTAKMICRRPNKVITIIQPHRYSRLRELFSSYVNIADHCDHIILLNVCSAGEKKTDNYDSEKLYQEMKKKSEKYIEYLSNFNDLPTVIGKITVKNDTLLIVSAGQCHFVRKLTDY